MDATREHFQSLYAALAQREAEVIGAIELECEQQLDDIAKEMDRTTAVLNQADMAYLVAESLSNEGTAPVSQAALRPENPAAPNLQYSHHARLHNLVPVFDGELLEALGRHGYMPHHQAQHHLQEQLQAQALSMVYEPARIERVPPFEEAAVGPTVEDSGRLSPHMAREIRAAMAQYLPASAVATPMPEVITFSRSRSRSPSRSTSPILPLRSHEGEGQRTSKTARGVENDYDNRWSELLDPDDKVSPCQAKSTI